MDITDQFDLRHLKAFAAVMSTGSITGAARLLGRSQPAVTRFIQELEGELGYDLLHRNGPRITPTDRGVLFHEEVERLLVGLNYIRSRAREIGREEPRGIEVAAIPALTAGLVPAALARVEGALPRKIHVRSASAEQVIQAVLARTADVGAASLPIEHPGLDVHWIGEAPCVVAVPDGDDLARRNVVAIRDLADRRVITMANPYRLRRRVDEALQRAGIVPGGLIETNATTNALMAVRAGLGVAIVEPVTAFGVGIKGLAIRPLDTAIPFLWGVMTPTARPLSALIEAFIGALESVAVECLPGFRRRDPGERSLTEAVYGRSATARHRIPRQPRKKA